MKEKSNGSQNDWPSKEQLKEWLRAARRYEKQIEGRRGLYLSQEFHKECCEQEGTRILLEKINTYQYVDNIYLMDTQWWEINQIGDECVLSLQNPNGRTLLSEVIPEIYAECTFYIVVDFGVIRYAKESESKGNA
ncbi:MAG TPA: hypothetical protein PK711_10230 [Bacteroidales bacterium]|nr:hypothetical protein [Bacteroidales bacterium]